MNEFKKITFINFLGLIKYEVKHLLRNIIRRGSKSTSDKFIKNINSFSGKICVIKNGLGFTVNGPSWFYTAFDRGFSDPLTNQALSWINSNIPKHGKVLMTGCGTGLMLFNLHDKGYTNLHGRDYMIECIHISVALKKKFNYDSVQFKVEDGFSPKFETDEKYDLITAMHWVFSAWMGNYGNKKNDNPYLEEVRKKLLNNFFDQYIPHLSINGILIVELTDSVTDYRVPNDGPLGLEYEHTYPVRQSAELVEECLEGRGAEIVEKYLCLSYGHQPRMAYYIKKLK